MKIAVYGATGSLGRLVVRELARQGVSPVLGGRSLDRLERLAAELGGARVFAAAIDDPAGLRALLDNCSAVINCAGPSSVCGEALVRAAIETGTHYVDAAGEQAFIRILFERYGPEAERRRVMLVPALGFDYALGDCIARLAARGHEPAEEVVVAYALAGPRVSVNSLRFALTTPGGGEVIYRDGRWQPAPLEIFRTSFPFPPPFGIQPMVPFASGEVVTVPRHTKTRAVTTLITTRSLVPHPFFVSLFPFLRPAIRVARQTPLWKVAAHLLRWLPAAEPGPAGARRRPSVFMIAAVVRGQDGSLGRGIVQGREFDWVGAATLVHGVRALAETGSARGGTFGPAEALDPAALLNCLADRGVSWSLDAG